MATGTYRKHGMLDTKRRSLLDKLMNQSKTSVSDKGIIYVAATFFAGPYVLGA